MKGKLIGVAFLAATLVGCGDDVLDWRNASVSGGKVYANKENKPFTGSLTNIPENKLPFNDAFNDLLVQHNRAMERTGNRQQEFVGRGLICDTTVAEGLVSGATACRDNSGIVRWKASLDGKGLDGNAEIYDVTGTKVITKSKYSKGLADGVLEIYGPNSAKLIGEYHTKNGKADGEQTSWDERTGKKTYHADTKDGSYIGLQETWTPEGRLTGQIPFLNGVVEGEVKAWNPQTGKQTELATFVRGQKLGRATTWDYEGNLISDGNYVAGGVFMPIQSSASSTSTEDDEWDLAVKPANKHCVDTWVDFLHKTNGEDSVVSLDQMKDWDSMCSNGQHPPA